MYFLRKLIIFVFLFLIPVTFITILILQFHCYSHSRHHHLPLLYHFHPYTLSTDEIQPYNQLVSQIAIFKDYKMELFYKWMTKFKSTKFCITHLFLSQPYLDTFVPYLKCIFTRRLEEKSAERTWFLFILVISLSCSFFFFLTKRLPIIRSSWH